MEMGLICAVIFTLLIMAYVGYSKGLIKIVLSLVMTIVAMIGAIVLLGPVSNVVENTKMYETIEEKAQDYVEKHIEKELNKASLEEQNQAIKKLKLPKAVEKNLISDNNESAMQSLGVSTFAKYVAKKLTAIIINALTVLCLYLILKLILRLVVNIFDIVSKLPVLNGLNRSAGMCVGLLQGLLLIWVACMFLTALGSTSFGADALKTIGENSFLSFLYNNNILTNFVA